MTGAEGYASSRLPESERYLNNERRTGRYRSP